MGHLSDVGFNWKNVERCFVEPSREFCYLNNLKRQFPSLRINKGNIGFDFQIAQDLTIEGCHVYR
jgi:hypothetical protein